MHADRFVGLVLDRSVARSVSQSLISYSVVAQRVVVIIIHPLSICRISDVASVAFVGSFLTPRSLLVRHRFLSRETRTVPRKKPNRGTE